MQTFGSLPIINQVVCPTTYNNLNTYTAQLADWAVVNDMQSLISINPVELSYKLALWDALRAARSGGVTYGSKGADYAEYLPRIDETEAFMPGDVVGVFGGKISRKTEGADQVLAISSYPIVLGNAPSKEEDLKKMEKVGFIGQVPVYVQGKVEIGDFIIPSGSGRLLKNNKKLFKTSRTFKNEDSGCCLTYFLAFRQMRTLSAVPQYAV